MCFFMWFLVVCFLLVLIFGSWLLGLDLSNCAFDEEGLHWTALLGEAAGVFKGLTERS